MLKCVNAPRSGSCETCELVNWGPFPGTAVIVEADQMLSSRGEGRLKRDWLSNNCQNQDHALTWCKPSWQNFFNITMRGWLSNNCQL